MCCAFAVQRRRHLDQLYRLRAVSTSYEVLRTNDSRMEHGDGNCYRHIGTNMEMRRRTTRRITRLHGAAPFMYSYSYFSLLLTTYYLLLTATYYCYYYYYYYHHHRYHHHYTPKVNIRLCAATGLPCLPPADPQGRTKEF